MRYKTAVEIFDISVPVRSDMPVYPGDPAVHLERVQDRPAVSRLDFGVHSGTHVDAPVHFIEGGFPAANPKDVEFFERMRDVKLNAKLVAFGATRRAGTGTTPGAGRS